jgi:hypothetical protein
VLADQRVAYLFDSALPACCDCLGAVGGVLVAPELALGFDWGCEYGSWFAPIEDHEGLTRRCRNSYEVGESCSCLEQSQFD